MLVCIFCLRLSTIKLFQIILFSQKSDNALTSTAASECLSQFSTLLGPSILRGRVEMYNPRYIPAYIIMWQNFDNMLNAWPDFLQKIFIMRLVHINTCACGLMDSGLDSRLNGRGSYPAWVTVWCSWARHFTNIVPFSTNNAVEGGGG